MGWGVSMAVLLRLVALAATAVADGTAELLPNRWTFHDPDFPVDIRVSPFADDQWNATHADLKETLAIPSTALSIRIQLPPVANLTDTQVAVAIFGQYTPRSTDALSRNLLDYIEKESPASIHSPFVVLADTQVQYAQSYRLNIRSDAHSMVMRVYVDSKLASGRTMRALFVRPIDLSPSEPFLPVCEPVGETDVALRLTSYPPTNVPPDLCSGYTMDGRVPIRKWYLDDQTDADSSYEARSFEYIETLIHHAKNKMRYYYNLTDDYLYDALAKYPIRGKHVLIIGSTVPWYEAICIAMEAASCTTIDYNKLRYDHPKIQTYTLGEFEATASRTQFDAIFSISSFEHDGLGRYGDPLDPNADLRAMKSLMQYCKPPLSDGDATRVYLAVPVGPDTVVWNAQRIYGPLRLPLLMEDWSVVESFGFSKADFTAPFSIAHQPLFVLEPKSPEPNRDDQHTEL